MLTFTALGGLSFRCEGASQSLTVFPGKPSGPVKGALALLAAPEEESTEGYISWPGEYSEGGIAIRGIGQNEGQQVSYVVEMEDVRCAFLSSPLQDWSERQLETVGDIDVLVLPADEAKTAQKLIDEFDPRILILMPGEDKAALDAIAKAVGVPVSSGTEEYKIKGQLPAEGREVVVLRK